MIICFNNEKELLLDKRTILSVCWLDGIVENFICFKVENDLSILRFCLDSGEYKEIQLKNILWFKNMSLTGFVGIKNLKEVY